jgi:transcription-repair coupling factor (superfamily II helicase)
MFDKFLESRKLRAAAEKLLPGTTLRICGVWGSSGPAIAAALARLTGRCLLLLAGHIDAADAAADDIEVFSGRPVQLFPAWEVDVGSDHLNEEVTGERLRVCNLLAEPPAERSEPVDVIVAPIMALLQPVPSPSALEAGRLELAAGDERDIESLQTWLIDAGFERVEQVEQGGEFARRGGIVDIFPLGTSQPVRIEFFGDVIESIRRFDLDSQRSTDQLGRFIVSGVSAGLDGSPAGGGSAAGATSLLSYLPGDAIVCMTAPAETIELARQLWQRSRGIAGRVAKAMLEPEDVLAELGPFAMAELSAFGGGDRHDAGDWLRSPGTTGTEVPVPAVRRLDMGQQRGQAPPNSVAEPVPFSPVPFSPVPFSPVPFFQLGIRSLERLVIGTHEALTELTELSATSEVWVYCENPAEQERFRDLLAEKHPALAGRVKLGLGHVASGFSWPQRKLVVVGHHELFGRYATHRRIRRVRAGRPIESLLDLQQGQYVVHVAHGIAKFDGLKLIDRDGRSEEYLALKFAGGTILHVPASRIDLIQRYIGSRKFRPSLSKLGGTTWGRQKQRVSEAVKDLAAEMIRVQAMRKYQPGFSYPRLTQWQRQFSDEFIYTETQDQISTMRQLDEDLAASSPMDRLLCGDVGYGKTELAMRAAFKVVEAGRQAAVLVPTTVLAGQHLRTFSERMADYPFEIDVISRFRTAGEQAKIIARLARGEIDIIIGTHRLLSKDIRFADLGLVVIDEEQRFGVEHKEHLKGLRASVDVLTMTATPIPRTLHMALLGLRDISSLTTPPMDRRAIHTEVVHYDERLIREAIGRELNRQGQVFFVHNRVQNIQAMADRVQRLAPEARVEIGHGRMKEHQLEKVMLRFVRQEIDVLVCTTIIESGLDIPTANTIIIHEADRFGLAALHQLRGRVGRYKHRAFCYLLLPEHRCVSALAGKRLKAVEEFSDLGAGFQISMRDLEIRGAGNILGREQSGHIATVGYELYCQLLDTAVRQLRGEKLQQRQAVHIELGIDAYIPRSYIISERQRMEVYRRMANCQSPEDLVRLRGDLADACGPLPGEVETLLDLAEARVLAGQLGIASIILIEPDLVFAVRDFHAAKGVFEGVAGTVRLPDDHTAHWRLPQAWREMPTMLRILLKRLREGRGTGSSHV